MSDNNTNEVVVITGTTSGIGRATARKFGQDSARVALDRMVPWNTGTLVQVGSAMAYRGILLQSAYSGSKFAIRGVALRS